MASPNGTGSPSQYQPNPADDRLAVAAGVGEQYRAMAAAIEEVEGVLDPETGTINARHVRRPLRSAESALRRAAWALIAFHA